MLRQTLAQTKLTVAPFHVQVCGKPPQYVAGGQRHQFRTWVAVAVGHSQHFKPMAADRFTYNLPSVTHTLQVAYLDPPSPLSLPLVDAATSVATSRKGKHRLVCCIA